MTAAKKTATVKKVAAKAVPTLKRTANSAIAQKTGKSGAPQPLKAKSRASAATPATLAPVKRARTDWDAVERDYRTGKYSLRELGARHGADHGLISRKAKKGSWTQDLSVAIKQATNAKLTQLLVNTEVNESHQKVNAVVSAAADENTRIILSHRTRLIDLADAVDAAKAKLLALGDTVADIREAATFVQAVGNLANATKMLIDQERRAHNLDDLDERNTKSDPMTALIASISGGKSSLQVVQDADE